MDSFETRRQLAEAEAGMALAESHIARQRRLIDQLEHGVAQAKALLSTLEESRKFHAERRDRLLKELWDNSSDSNFRQNL